MEKLTIIKVGGAIVEEESSLDSLLACFAKIEGQKVLVHGGGRLATKIAGQLGIESRMIEGRRITDEDTLRIVTMVYAGLVNKNIVARLQAIGVDAVGLTGADMNLIRSVKRPAAEIDYGFVGDVSQVNIQALTLLLSGGYVPVISPITHDLCGNLLNTNADTIAAETAKALSDHFDVTLVYCFEKSGVLRDENDDKSVIPHIDRRLYDEYKQSGVVGGGMIPKLDNAFRAIEAGVKQVIITKAQNLNSGNGTVVELKI